MHGTYGSRGLELAVALTGLVATMPYIALQLIGMGVVIKAMGLTGEAPIIIAFVVLALYTYIYSSGLRAPALIDFVKDIMICIVVLVAVVVVPAKLGGYGAVFSAASLMKALPPKSLGGSNYTFFGHGALLLVVAVIATVIVQMVTPKSATARS